MYILLNVALYQAVWFLCVFKENQGAVIALTLLIVHLYFSPYRVKDLRMMVFLLAIGALIDGTLYLAGFMTYNVRAMPIPFWLAVVWLALATLPHHSLKWLKGRLVLASLLGALGGPLAYWAGVKAGAASFTLPLMSSLILLALIWGVLWPFTMYIADKDLPKNE
jgi:hypothetical protein